MPELFPAVVCRPVFARGSGLGNRLFPWARCLVFSRANSVPMIRPQWEQLRLGPLLRGGVSLRRYHSQILLWGLFQSETAACFRHLAADLFYRRENEPRGPFAADGKRTVVEFRGDGRFFADFEGERRLVRAELEAIARPRWTRLAASFGEAPIAMNVRRAKDFPDVASASGGPRRTPLDWFARTLALVRRAAGRDAEALVVSDGTPADLAPLLSLGNVRLVRPGCAISDLLVLSRAKVLLASGGSSFSAWASFLGGMPTVSIPGQSLGWFGLTPAPGRFVGEFDPDSPAEDFLTQAAERIGR